MALAYYGVWPMAEHVLVGYVGLHVTTPQVQAQGPVAQLWCPRCFSSLLKLVAQQVPPSQEELHSQLVESTSAANPWSLHRLASCPED